MKKFVLFFGRDDFKRGGAVDQNFIGTMEECLIEGKWVLEQRSRIGVSLFEWAHIADLETMKIVHHFHREL